MVGLSLGGLSLGLGARNDGGWRFRAVAQRGRIPNAGGFASNWAEGARVRHILPVPARRIKLVLPTFSVATLADVDMPYATDFQAAIEYPYQAAITGLSARNPVLFGGSETAHYDPTTGPFPAVVSDIYDLGVTVPAGTAIGSWVSLEFSARASQGASKLPTSNNVGSTTYTTYERCVAGTTSLVDASWAKTATTLAAGFAGPAQAYVPMLLVDCGPGTKSYLVIGDSIAYGTNEGYNGSGTKGDFRGNANGDAGWVDRWLSLQGKAFANFSNPSDQLQYVADPAKNHRRRALAAIMNPTDMIIELATNDVFARSVAQMTTDIGTIISAFRTAIGSTVPVHISTLLPKSTSTNNWIAADGSDQTASSQFGPGTKAADWNALVRALSLGNASYIDAQSQIQVGAIDSFKWQGDGVTTKLNTIDGVHPTSDAYDKIATGLGAAP